MSIHFDRPIGAAADVKELEYVSALHQTDLNCVRTDGSLRDEDIQLFLLSRYGIDVTVDHVRETVLKGLGGGSGDDDDCIDLMEMVAILLIPTLLKAALLETAATTTPTSITASGRPSATLHPKLKLPHPGLLKFVLGMILQDVTGKEDPKELTPDLVKSILQAYGENEIANNDKLVQEMVDAAREDLNTSTNTTEQMEVVDSEDVGDDRKPAPKLDLTTFARALTYDVKLYDVNNEIRVSSNYDDIFFTHNQKDAVSIDQDKTARDGGNNNDNDNSHPLDEESVAAISKDERDQLSQSVSQRFTASSIDFTAGTYRSKGLTILLWAAFIITYFAYDFNYANNVVRDLCVPYNYTYHDPWVKNQEAIGCTIYANVYKWLVIFLFASLFGFAYVGLGSIGNSVRTKAFWTPLVGFLAVFLLTYLHYKGIYAKDKLSKLSNNFIKSVSLALGMIVCALHLLHSLALLFPSATRAISGLRLRYFALTGTLLGEAYIKQAAAHKLGEMVRNALETLKHREKDGVVDTNFGHGLLSFAKHGKRFCEEGGYVWTWKRAFSNDLVKREGIWFSTRFLASNIAQYIVSVFVLLAGIGLTISAKNNFSEANAKRVVSNFLNQAINTNTDPNRVQAVTTTIGRKVSDYLVQNANCSDSVYQEGLNAACSYVSGYYQCDPRANVSYICALANLTAFNATAYSATEQAAQNAYLQAAGFDSSGTKQIVEDALQQASSNALDTFYPSRRFMIVMPVAMATVIAFIVSLYLATTYLPSVTSTTLKLRTGVIPSLRDKRFHTYRMAPDQVTIVTGSMFWGALISSTLVGGLVALIVFLFIWQVTVVFVQRFLALIVGITVVVLIKLVIVLTCRCTLYKGFYRRRPLLANLSSLALECANFALSAGFVFLRMVKLLFTAAVFIGRIDTPFLAPGVGKCGPLELDYYPYIYRKDILASEAHRHPYIETLGVMYLMKLRYGDNFGKSAGSCWRLLFVYALMPWLHRYRVLARPELLANQSNNADGRHSLTRMQTVKSMRLFVHDLDDDDDDDVDDNDIDEGSHPTSKSILCQQTSKPSKHQQMTPETIETTEYVQSSGKIAGMAESPNAVDELKLENMRLKHEIEELKSKLFLAQANEVKVDVDSL